MDRGLLNKRIRFLDANNIPIAVTGGLLFSIATVISGGFVGLGLGATPVAIANMDAVTHKYGPSAKAFLVIPLIGAFFVDILNALVIKLFIALPFMTAPS